MHKETLKADLRRLGLTRGSVVMTHDSLKAIGWMEEGPETLIRALLEVIGPEGTLMKYIGCPEEQPFDTARSPAVREWGLSGEILRQWPGARRSFHPDSSFVAVGALAAWLTENHPLSYGFGPDSPCARFVSAQGQVLLIGCPLEHLTLLHHSEHEAELPYKKTVNFERSYLIDGELHKVSIEEFDTSTGIVDWPGPEDYFATIVKDYLAMGQGATGRIGHATAHRIDARGMHAFAKTWMEKNLKAYVVHPDT